MEVNTRKKEGKFTAASSATVHCSPLRFMMVSRTFDVIPFPSATSTCWLSESEAKRKGIESKKKTIEQKKTKNKKQKTKSTH